MSTQNARNKYRRDYLSQCRSDGIDPYCEVTGQLFERIQNGWSFQIDHILSAGSFPEIADDHRNMFATNQKWNLDFWAKKIGRPSLYYRLDWCWNHLPERFEFLLEAAKRKLKPDEYDELKERLERWKEIDSKLILGRQGNG